MNFKTLALVTSLAFASISITTSIRGRNNMNANKQNIENLIGKEACDNISERIDNKIGFATNSKFEEAWQDAADSVKSEISKKTFDQIKIEGAAKRAYFEGISFVKQATRDGLKYIKP